MPEKAPRVDLAHYEVLSESLGTPDKLSMLHGQAVELLRKAGAPCTINGD